MPFKLNASSKLTIVLLFLLMVFLGNLRYQQWKNQSAIEKEKKRLEEQISALNKKNQDLSDSLSYLNSSDFKDKMARQQLNLKRDGEVVFGFTDAPTTTSAAGNSPLAANMTNYEKWIEYFFGSN